jgi:pimeloyl-[acyl-carrier protein] methyl ester esterase
MEASWLHKSDRKNLIVFCNGWGMDGFPFRSMVSIEYDVYMLHDYRQLDKIPDIDGLAENYEQVILISWSMGVWVGQKLFSDKRHLFHRTIAINGTLCPIDDRFGIPTKVFDATMVGYGESARLKFYKRMCREKTNLNTFLKKQPRRTLEDQGEELAALKKMVDCIPADESIYKEIIISESDWIVPSANQFDFWQGKLVTSVSGFHYLFNLWQSWDHLLNFSDAAA